MMRRAGRRPLRAHSRSYPITPYFTIKYTQFQVNRREIHKSFSFFIKEKPANCQIGGAPAVKLQKKKAQSRTTAAPKTRALDRGRLGGCGQKTPNGEKQPGGMQKTPDGKNARRNPEARRKRFGCPAAFTPKWR